MAKNISYKDLVGTGKIDISSFEAAIRVAKKLSNAQT